MRRQLHKTAIEPMSETAQDHSSIMHALTRGATGVIAAFGGTVVSMLPEIEAWLRITSLGVGIVVGLCTIHSIVKNSKKQPPVNND